MKKVIYTEKAPKPIGPYSQAVLNGDTLYVSGQIALHPQTGILVQESLEAETKQVMENIKAILEATDMTFANVLKCTIFIRDINKFADINAVYGSYFFENPPARETVEVSRLPKDVSVEISCIAAR